MLVSPSMQFGRPISDHESRSGNVRTGLDSRRPGTRTLSGGDPITTHSYAGILLVSGAEEPAVGGGPAQSHRTALRTFSECAGTSSALRTDAVAPLSGAVDARKRRLPKTSH